MLIGNLVGVPKSVTGCGIKIAHISIELPNVYQLAVQFIVVDWKYSGVMTTVTDKTFELQ